MKFEVTMYVQAFKIHIAEQMATSPRKEFFLLFYYHTCVIVHYTVCAVNMLLVLFIFFSSAGYMYIDKPCDGDSKHAFFIGPISLVANNTYTVTGCFYLD
jgi:hypothetical protein